MKASFCQIGGPFQSFVFAAAAKACQVLVYTSNEGEVTPSTGGAAEKVAGIAIYDVAAGALGSVAMAGNIIKVINADDTAVIPAGAWVETNDNPVKGTVSGIDFTASGALAIVHTRTVGQTVRPIPAGGSGYALINPVPVTVPNAT